MPLMADMITALLAAGTPAEKLPGIIAVLEIQQAAKEEERLAKKRAGNAERQHRLRERRRSENNGSNALCGVTERDEAPLISSSERDSPSSPPTGAQSPPTKTKRGRSLPDDWQPKPRHFEAAAGLGQEFVNRCAEAMRRWAGANSNRQVARKADWDLTFDGWLDREIGKLSAARAPPSSSRQQPRDGFAAWGDYFDGKTNEPPTRDRQTNGSGSGEPSARHAGGPDLFGPGDGRPAPGGVVPFRPGRAVSR